MRHKAKGKRKPKPIPEHVTEKEYYGLIKVIDLIHHKMAIMLAKEGGLRISECLNVYPNDVNLENKTIKIREGKGMKDRIIPLPYSFQPEVHMQYLPIACSKRALETAFTKAAIESGLKAKKPKVCFHSLRHGFAVDCLDKGMSLQQIQILMGHEDIQTTQHYARMNPKEALDAWREKVAQDG